MPVTVKFDPHTTMPQSAIIQDATEQNDGVMTAAMVRKLNGLTPGAGAIFFTVVKTAVAGSVDYGQLVEADPSGGSFDINLPIASDADPTVGNIFIVKNVGLTNAVGLRRHVGNSTDGPLTLEPGQWAMYISDGVSNFVCVADNITNPVTLSAVVTAAYNALGGDYIQADPTAGPFNIALPVADTMVPGTIVEVKNISSSGNAVTILTGGGNTIDGDASVDVGALEYARFVSNGVDTWYQSA